MAKTKNPPLEIGPATEEQDVTSLILPVPTMEMILPPEMEAKIRADISAIIEKYTGFEIMTDAEATELAKELRGLVKKRTMVDGKDGWRLSVKRLADTIGGKIVGILAPAETLLAGIKKKYDDAKAERQRLAREAAEKLLADRKQEMFTLGATYNGSAYVLGNVEIYPEDLPGDGYLLKIEKMRAEKVRLDEVERVRKENEEKERQAELERQRVAREAADKLAIENARIEAENKALPAALTAAKVEPAAIDETDAGPADLTLFIMPKVPDVLAILNEPTGEPVVTTAPLMRSEPILDTTARDVEKYGPVVIPEQPAVKVDSPAVTAPSAKFVPMEIDFANDADLVHAYKTGAYAFVKQARAKFPAITPTEWKALWEEFLAGTKPAPAIVPQFKCDYCGNSFPESEKKMRCIRRNRKDVTIAVCSDQCAAHAQMSAEG